MTDASTDSALEAPAAATGTPALTPTGAAGLTVPVAASASPHAQRTRMMLEGPILATLLRLAVPNVLLMVVQAAMSVLETYYVSGLGTEALAGVALVFPLLMLTQMLSAGAMGGGVSSSIARALGGGRQERAQALVLHALVIATAIGAVFTVGVLSGGPALYRVLGGVNGALHAAVTYSGIVFAGAILLWWSNTLANILRGTGNMVTPAVASVSSALLPIVLSPALIYGWGPLPRLEVAGAGIGILAYYGCNVAWMGAYLAGGRAAVRLSWRGVRLAPGLFWDILRVGLLSSFGALMTNLTIIAVTGMVGTFGTAALAGYGIGSRLEYLLIPIVFGVGAALVSLVGTNFGAGQVERAHRIAWSGAALAGSVTLAIGLVAALWPALWSGLFTDEPAVLAAANGYLRHVAPFYGLFGVGMALYFASQGAGRMGWPVTVGVLRFVIVVGGSWIAVHWLSTGLGGIFTCLAVGLLLFGTLIAGGVWAGIWRRA